VTEKEQLIEAWTRNLEDNAEHQMHAIGLLTEEIDDNAASIPVVSAMLQKVTPQSRKHRRLVIWSLVFLAVALCLTNFILPIQLRMLFNRVNFSYISAQEKPPKIRTNSPSDQLLLYGDPSRIGKAEQMRALWESDPKNPAYFADYSLHYIQEKAALPPDFLKIAAEIDPDNAWFTFIAAAMKSKDVCKKGNEHPRSPINKATASAASHPGRILLSKKIVYEYNIHDPTRAEEALVLWRQSLKQNKYDSYEIALHQKRYPLLKNRTSVVDQYTPIIYLMTERPVFLKSRDLTMLLTAQLQKADLQSEEGKQLMSDITSFTERITFAEPGTLVDLLMLSSNLRTVYQQIHVIDTSSLEPGLRETWKKRIDAMDERERLLQEDQNRIANDEIVERHGSMLTSLALPAVYRQTTLPLRISNDDLTPMRYVDHILFLRIIAAAVTLLLVLMLPFHLFARRKKLIHTISEEAWQAIPWQFMVRMVLLCVVVPLVYYYLLTVFTPLTGKEFGPRHGFVFPFCPAISIALLLLLLPRLLVHRFTAKWEELGSSKSRKFRTLGWVSCVLLLIPLHASPMLLNTKISAMAFCAYLLICWVPAVLWLLWNGAKEAFSRNHFQRVMHGMRRRVVGFCSVSAVLLLALASWALKVCEKNWIQQDKIMAISQERLTLNFEAEVIQALHSEFRTIMEK
jgi:hypothetical protein